MEVRDWSLITGRRGAIKRDRGGGGARTVLALQKERGGTGKGLAMLKGGGGGAQNICLCSSLKF